MIFSDEAIIQFIKYAFAGAVATGVHITIFHLLAWRCFPALQAGDYFVKAFKLSVLEVDDTRRSKNVVVCNWLAFPVSNSVTYILNALWVFDTKAFGGWFEVLVFFLVSAISIAIGNAVMRFLIKRDGLLTTYAFVINVFSSVLINFVVRKYLIFTS